jgi:hypothetical protein
MNIQHLSDGFEHGIGTGKKNKLADPHHFNANLDPVSHLNEDSDPDPIFHCNVDPSSFHSYAGPNPAYQNNADPDPQPL